VENDETMKSVTSAIVECTAYEPRGTVVGGAKKRYRLKRTSDDHGDICNRSMEEMGERARTASLIGSRHSSMPFEVINTHIHRSSFTRERETLSEVSVSDFPCGVLETSFRVALGSTQENEVSSPLIFLITL